MKREGPFEFSLYVSDEYPHLIGCMSFGDVHYQLVGVRHPNRYDMVARRGDKIVEVQHDFFDERPSDADKTRDSKTSGARKANDGEVDHANKRV
jgi:hypothetical protein